ncbi:MAG: hypothetical protein GC204_15005 [Chloroflexi bacterium]|nr:hypothetical protein [Chloroflexota bacterium]
MWNLRARMMYYQGFVSASRFEWLYHPEYPPLVPLVIALGYKIFGDTALVNITLHGMVLAALILLFRRWWTWIIIGVVALFYAPFQYIDLVVALAFLVAVMCYANRHDFFAGVALGVMLLLKNEGLPTALIFLAIWTIADRRLPWRSLLGLLPGLLLLIAWRLWINQPTDLFAGQGILERALDFSRQLDIIPAMLIGLVTFAWGAILLSAIWAVVSRVKIRMFTPLIAIAFIFIMDWMIYTISYWNPVTEHISTSWDRLILQVFPVLLYVLSGATRTPQPSSIHATAHEEVGVEPVS